MHIVRIPAINSGEYDLMSLTGAILSLLVISSFGRVVERHEREAMMQNPSTWEPLYKVEEATHGKVRRGISSASVASNPRRKRSVGLPPDSMGTPKVVPNRILKVVQEKTQKLAMSPERCA